MAKLSVGVIDFEGLAMFFKLLEKVHEVAGKAQVQMSLKMGLLP